MFGKPTGRAFVARTIADCMIFENRIFREWVVRDNMALFVQLGLDTNAHAARVAKNMLDRGMGILEISENRRILGQNPLEDRADVSIAHSDSEAECLRWLHEIYNKRMFGKIRDVYAPNAMWHGTRMRELYGPAAVLAQTLRPMAMMPDGVLLPQHICSTPSDEGGEKIAVRWVLDGHHLGYGILGDPTGHRMCVLGFTHFHIIGGKIVDE